MSIKGTAAIVLQNLSLFMDSIPLNYLGKIGTIFKKTILYEGLKYGGKKKSEAHLVKDLGI